MGHRNTAKPRQAQLASRSGPKCRTAWRKPRFGHLDKAAIPIVCAAMSLPGISKTGANEAQAPSGWLLKSIGRLCSETCPRHRFHALPSRSFRLARTVCRGRLRGGCRVLIPACRGSSYFNGESRPCGSNRCRICSPRPCLDAPTTGPNAASQRHPSPSFTQGPSEDDDISSRKVCPASSSEVVSVIFPGGFDSLSRNEPDKEASTRENARPVAAMQRFAVMRPVRFFKTIEGQI